MWQQLLTFPAIKWPVTSEVKTRECKSLKLGADSLNNKQTLLLFVCLSPPGCTGAIAYELTKAHPGLSVTVFDLPAVVEMSEHFHPSHKDNRVSFVAGPFAHQHQKHC